MDQTQALSKAKWLLGAGAFFLLSCFFVYDEFAYLVWGHETQATITKAHEVTGRTHRGTVRSHRLEIEFAFTDTDGKQRKGIDTVSRSWSGPRTGTVPIQFTPGELGRARLKGHRNWTGIVMFVLGVGAIVVLGVMAVREANEAYRPRKRKRRD